MIAASNCPDVPDYELIRIVGKGAYGDVWLARSITGIYRAVKVVWRERFSEPQPFEREFRGLRDFARVPNSERRQLALLHVGRNDESGYFYYVMELADDIVSGQRIDPDRYEPLTLKRYLAQKNRLRVAEVVHYAVEITQALAELHAHGLVHRDIKPSNLVLVGGHPKLADIGLVAAVNATSIVGTEGFMPPEGPGTPSSDVYSLGKVIYELATNLDRKQFPRLPEDLLTRDDAPQLMELNEVIVRACDTSPGRRYPDADTMLHELRLLQEGRSLRRMRLTERGLARARRIVTTLLIIAGIGFGGAFIERQRAEREAVGRRAAEAERDRLARFLAYSGGLSRAQRALANGDFGRARELLRDTARADEHGEETPPFEWRALWQAAQGDPAIVLRENGPSVERVDYSSDGRWFAIHDNSKTTTVYDATTREPVKVLHGLYRFGGFSADGRWILGTTPNLKLQAWDLETGLPIGVPQSSGFNHPIGVYPDGGPRLLVFHVPQRNSPPELSVWDLLQGAEVRAWKIKGSVGPPWKARELALLRENGRISLVTLQDDAVRSVFRQVQLGNEPTVAWPTPGQHGVNAITSPALASAITHFKTQSILPIYPDLNSDKDAPNELSAIAQSYDGKRIAAGSTFGGIAVFDANDGSKLHELYGHSGAVTSLCIHSDKYDLLSGDSAGHVRLWRQPYESSRREIEGLIPLEGQDQTVIFSPNGELLATVSVGDIVTVLTRGNLRRQTTIQKAVGVLAVDSQGTVSGLGTDGKLQRWDSRGKLLQSVSFPWHAGATASAVLSADGETIAAISDTRQLAIARSWTDPLIVRPAIGETTLHKLTICDSGEYVAAVVDEINVHIWSVRDAADVLVLPYSPRIQDISFSPDGRLLAVCFVNGEVAIVDVVERRTLNMFRVSSAAVSATFAPDSNRMVCIARNGMLHVYRTADWREVATLEDEPIRQSPQSRVASIAFSPDGLALAVHRHDGKLRLWLAP